MFWSLFVFHDDVRAMAWRAFLLLIVGVAAVRARRGARSFKIAPGEILVIGESSNLGALSGVLWGGRADAQAIRKVRSPDEAGMLAATAPCALAVVADLNMRGVRLTDVRGRVIPVMTDVEVIERLLGRTPLDLLPNDLVAAESRLRYGPSRRQDVAKRGFDLLVAGVLALLTLPLTLVIALVARWTDGSPIVAGTPCIGKDGKPFVLRQFRTNPVAPASNYAAERVSRRSSQWSIFLHASHLNLLPSLWNVIRGDLSMVGPRPETEAHVRLRSVSLPAYRLRMGCRPGLVSLAQVQFRYTEATRDVRMALEYDLYYVKHRSVRLDLHVFARGLGLAVADGGAYLGTRGKTLWRVMTRALADSWLRPSPRGRIIISTPLPKSHDRDDGPLLATLLVGAGNGGRLMANEMRSNPAWGYWPVGYLDDDPAKIGTRLDGLPVLGATEAMAAITRREHIDAIVIAIPSAPEATINRIAELARGTAAQILTMPHLGQSLRSSSGQMRLTSVRITDILGRPVVHPDLDRCRTFIAGRRVLVTGAAGSIGSEVARQVATLNPALLIGLDINESDLFDLQQELASADAPARFAPVVASITNRLRIEEIFARFQPEIVFHAAAYKHVPMMEEHPQEAVWSNTIGTYETARAAAEAGVARFVLVSSDKAVRPSSVMGATKRLAELALRAVSDETGLSACAVRFGNVLGSRGSVIPTFEKQIKAGGPITVTDPRMKRYFMTILEAAGLIVQAGAFGDRNVIYMLDMGDEVAITDLAARMIELHGLRVGVDIAIAYTGLRPGEKLREELSLDFEAARPTSHSKIRILSDAPHAPSRPGSIGVQMARLAESTAGGDRDEIRRVVMSQVALADQLELRWLRDGQHWLSESEGEIDLGASLSIGTL